VNACDGFVCSKRYFIALFRCCGFACLLSFRQLGQVVLALIVRLFDFLSLEITPESAFELIKKLKFNPLFDLRNDLPAVNEEEVSSILSHS